MRYVHMDVYIELLSLHNFYSSNKKYDLMFYYCVSILYIYIFIHLISLHLYECILCVDVYVCACTRRVRCIICNIRLGAI